MAPVVHAQVVLSQHTPVHGVVGVQVPPLPLYVVPPGHPVVGAIVQAQLVLSQHGPQLTPAQVALHTKVLAAAQAPVPTTVHAPEELLQHRPMQGVGEQVPEQ